jgi:hypothetical protein
MECVDLDVDVDLLAQRGESGRLLRGQGAPADGEGRTGRREMANFDPKMAESACSKSRKERSGLFTRRRRTSPRRAPRRETERTHRG